MDPTLPSQSSVRRRWTRVAIVMVPSLAFVALLAWATTRSGGPPTVGDPVPELEGPLLEGDGNLALSDLRGKPVFVNFWWSGCAPCKDEAPLLRDAYDRYGEDVAFVGVNIRDKKSEALAFASEYGLDYPSIRDEGLALYRRWGLTGQPESFFIDADGILVQHVAGPVFEADLARLLDMLKVRSG